MAITNEWNDVAAGLWLHPEPTEQLTIRYSPILFAIPYSQLTSLKTSRPAAPWCVGAGGDAG